MNDPINHPQHYSGMPAKPIECIAITRWMPFNLGNAFKYVWRAGKKGDCKEDLQKANWYLDDMLASLKECVLDGGKLNTTLYPYKTVAQQIFMLIDMERYSRITRRNAILTYLVNGDILGADMILISTLQKGLPLDDLLNPVRCEGPKCQSYPDGCGTNNCLKKVQEDRIHEQEMRCKESME